MSHPPATDLDDELRHLLAEFTGSPPRRSAVPGALIAGAFTLVVAGVMLWLATR